MTKKKKEIEKMKILKDQGISYIKIASILKISPTTVTKYLKNYSKGSNLHDQFSTSTINEKRISLSDRYIRLKSKYNQPQKQIHQIPLGIMSNIEPKYIYQKPNIIPIGRQQQRLIENQEIQYDEQQRIQDRSINNIYRYLQDMDNLNELKDKLKTIRQGLNINNQQSIKQTLVSNWEQKEQIKKNNESENRLQLEMNKLNQTSIQPEKIDVTPVTSFPFQEEKKNLMISEKPTLIEKEILLTLKNKEELEVETGKIVDDNESNYDNLYFAAIGFATIGVVGIVTYLLINNVKAPKYKNVTLRPCQPITVTLRPYKPDASKTKNDEIPWAVIIPHKPDFSKKYYETNDESDKEK